LHPRQVNCFFANFIIPLFEGVEIETALVWLPWSSSLLAFFKIGSNILNSGWQQTFCNSLDVGKEKLWISRKVFWTNFANLILKVVLGIYWYVIVQNIYWVFWLLICLYAETQMYQNRDYSIKINDSATRSTHELTFAPLAAFIIT
jgi:hypothetical protein